MKTLRAICRVGTTVLILTVLFGLVALYELLKPIPNHCNMTYMYPTFVPVPTPEKFSGGGGNYELFLYREGWSRISHKEHINKLRGVPVLFIPGNAGSYKQVRSLAKESHKAYQTGPPESQFYQEAYPNDEDGIGFKDIEGVKIPKRYTRMLDWFTVNFQEEHSAMDAQILQAHTKYVVYAIHTILAQYKESHEMWSKEEAETSRTLPRSVILVGHSMGGFVARAAIVHPDLMKGAVETILTLSSPHQSPPVALQPSLAHYYSHVNQEWRKGYQVQPAGQWVSEPTLSNVVIISVSGGPRDYQVRSHLESLDRIVPPTHGFMISSTSMKNVWLSTEHQVILWCNQLVVQVSHTLLSLIDSESGQPFASTHKRMHVFIKMLRSGIPERFDWMRQVHSVKVLKHVLSEDDKVVDDSQVQTFSPCPKVVSWNSDGLEKEINIETTTFNVSGMDGRRRWLEIQKLGSKGRNHFIFVTYLTPCIGVRLHLWPEKGEIASEVPMDTRVIEVTSKMVYIPTGLVPRKTEPGSLNEPLSSIFWLGPEDMRGFRFLTISVAQILPMSGRPPPAVPMGVGQFFNPEEGKIEFSRRSLMQSIFAKQELSLVEDHPLSLNLPFSISLGLLPVTLSLRAVSCGMKRSGHPVDGAEDAEHSKLCKQRCFPPVAVALDSTSDVHIIPNFYNETIVVDSSPESWRSTQGSDGTTVLLMVDPHCSYNISIAASITTAALRFMLLYFSQIVGFSFALVFFALTRQTRKWETDLPVPSVLDAVESNLIMPLTFLCGGVVPLVVLVVLSLLISQTFPSFTSLFIISTFSYTFANGFVIILIMITKLVLYVAANVHIFFKTWCQVWEDITAFKLLCRFFNSVPPLFSLKAVRIVKDYQIILTALLAFILVCFVHPALGLFILLFPHGLDCHNALCSYLMASSHSHAQRKEMFGSSNYCVESTYLYSSRRGCNQNLRLEENSQASPKSQKSYSDAQLEVFNHCHGMLILHFLAALMFVPSIVAQLQRNWMAAHSFLEFLDVALCVGIILHGLYGSKPRFSSLHSRLPSQVGMSFVYLLTGYCCYLFSLDMAPYRALYAMAVVGYISSALTLFERREKQHRQ